MRGKWQSVILGALLLLSIFFIYINRFTPEMEGFTKAVFGINISRHATVVPLDSSAQYSFARLGNDIVICGGDKIRAYNSGGQEEWSLPLGMGQPILSAGRRSLLIADREGNQAKIISGGKEQLSITTNEPVITARMNQSGYFALVTKEKGYKGKITVYNPKGAEIYKWYSGKGDIIDVDISGDGRRMAVATLELDTAASGRVLMFDLSSAEPFSENITRDNVIISINYAKDGIVYGIGDSAAVGYSSKGEPLWTADYEGRSLATIAGAEEDGFVIGLSGGAVAAYTHRGKPKGNYKTNGEIHYFDAKDDVVVINKHREIVLINTSGREIAKRVAGRDIRDAVIFPDKKHLLLLSGSSAEIVRMGG